MNNSTGDMDAPLDQPVEPKAPRSTALLKRSHVKAYALAVSKHRRANKFVRVSESFINSVEAEFESKIRALHNAPYNAELTPLEGLSFVTGFAKERLADKSEELVRAIISGKVMRHPTVGVTLQG